MVPDAGELLFSIIFSYMGALEFFFIARNLYHWGFKHHKRMMNLSDDPNSLNELQEQIKAAINEAKEKEMYGLNAMKDGVLYKDGFRVSPGIDNEKTDRQVIGSSRNSLEKKTDLASEVNKGDETTRNKSSVESKKQNEFDVASGEQQQRVTEEPFVKKQIKHEMSENYREENKNTAADDKRTNLTQTIKTQLGQTDSETYSSKSEATAIENPGLRTTKSDDSSSNEPASTHRSALSNQESSSLETMTSAPEILFDEYDRPEPDGQDVNEPQYSEDYLRSLDGIKYRPLVREDGTGRRRAFKKRRSSADSTSSRESRASREEELKMFTSLEEEESEAIKRGDTNYAPIRYSSDPNLKGDKHTRRHKRSPVKGSKDSEENRSSLEMLNEESGNPWGEVKPEHYKDTEFWKREKTNSIEEENENNSTEQAIQKWTSESPGRHVPKMSSFEDATRSEHENVIESLQRSRSRDVETTDNKKSGNETSGNAKNVSMYESDEKASSPSLASNLDASAILSTNQKSFETDENIVHDQQTDALMQKLSSKLRRSPRQDDMEYYEERFIEEERKASRTPSPRPLELKTVETPENKDEKETESSDLHSAGIEKSEDFTSDRKTPRIEIDYAPDIENPDIQTFEDDWEEENEELTTLMEGVSDFYDFNASVNPLRSSSRARSEEHSQSQSRISEQSDKSIKSRESSPYQKHSRSVSPQALLSSRGIPGVSDWYDYNVMLNRRAYGIQIENFRKVHQSSTDFIISQLKTTNNIANRNENESKHVEHSSPDTVGGKAKSKERSLTLEIRSDTNNVCTNFAEKSNITTYEQNDDDSLKNDYCPDSTVPEETVSENSVQQTPDINQTEEPPTPQFPRSFSAERRDTERIREDFKRDFTRSRYAAESVDLSDEFEELREKTKQFRRSRSKSRTPTDEDLKNAQIGKIAERRKLQDKILAQITKTTLDYQDFAKDISLEFLNHERRGSDSALLQKPQILIQIQDNQSKDGDFDDEDDLEAEEYHHFRRFSLNQEAQVEEYPADDYLLEYIQKIDLTKVLQMQTISDEIVEESSDQIEADDQEDSGSDDERLTVVEVDDEIDEDICDFEKSDDQFNEQSECEEAEREVDRYVNHSAKDWKEEGAVGGVTEWHNTNIDRENAANIEDMYDDAVKYGEAERMEKDYENIIEAMNNENRNKIDVDVSNDVSDNISIKTEDILEEILKDDEERYRRVSPKQNVRSYLQSSSQNFIDHEKENDEIGYYVSTATVVHHNTKSTRLRSRYHLPPSTVYRNYDYDLENSEIDLNYKPKKEYNWRKNFKIDDDGDDDFTKSASRKLSSNGEGDQSGEENGNENNNNNRDYLDVDKRKYSLGGESITLYSRSFESEERQLEIVSMEDEAHMELNVEINHRFQENGESIQYEMDSGSTQQNEKIFEHSKDEDAMLEAELPDVLSKKKKIKKKSRRGSKASIGDEDLNSLNTVDLTKPDDDDQTTSSSKKKIKKKKKVKVDIVSENYSPNIKSPEPENKTNSSEPKSTEPDYNQSNNQFKSSKSKSPTEPHYNQSHNSIKHSKSKSPESVSVKTETKSILNNSEPAVSRISRNTENISDTPQPKIANTIKTSPIRISKSPEPEKTSKEPMAGASGTQKTKPSLERQDSSGVYELIKDGSMYPWF